ncbi:hypothetical protein [Pseudomonas sp. R2-60-08W]|uniref:hypothetical protein n=1 Tax=Pseudomonas sp. R2-60-08W TaxID=1173280 RepID=UPI000F57BE5F|nr:hypothetical protein [Pseudomonas sp. R2-60-08W]AZF28498.1 hypothetical protein C4J90_4356 [Pseudomonas sp. R2-60-08W]
MLRFVFSGIALLAVAAASNAQAQTQTVTTPEQLLTEFSRCDARFFESLSNARLPANTVRLSQYGSVKAPTILNPLQEGGTYQQFDTPLIVNGVRMVGYYNQAQTMKDVGNFLFWGFVADGSPQEVAAKLKPLIVDNTRFVSQGKAITRAEIRRVGDPIGQWRTEGLTGPGVATPFGFVDRVLMVDTGDASPPLAGRTTVFCSLQGTVTAPLLQVYRPDLNARLFD